MGDLHMYINKSVSTLTSQWVDCRQVINVNNMKGDERAFDGGF